MIHHLCTVHVYNAYSIINIYACYSCIIYTIYYTYLHIIGGESIYKEAITLPQCHKIYLTSIEDPIYTNIDTYFPLILATTYRLIYRSHSIHENSIKFRFTEYIRIHTEQAFFDNSIFGSTNSTPTKHYYNIHNNNNSTNSIGDKNTHNYTTTSVTTSAPTTTTNTTDTNSTTTNSISSSISVKDSIPNYEEQQYLDILRDILENGVHRGDRTG